MLSHARGVALSYEEAVKWYRLAAAQGESEALYNLGICSQRGTGVPQDDHEAVRLYKRAAAQGHAGAAAAAEKLAAWLATRSGAAAQAEKFAARFATRSGRPPIVVCHSTRRPSDDA
mmetsp:Transcript_18275/g.61652  ORF Transcript_18275/g.61652 Transcript_18275/m.61652 type:complete len:117 (+) Transcript_18275:100-450(+)